MFLDSVLSALKIMTYWEIQVAALVYSCLFLAPIMVVCRVTDFTFNSNPGFYPCIRIRGLARIK